MSTIVNRIKYGLDEDIIDFLKANRQYGHNATEIHRGINKRCSSGTVRYHLVKLVEEGKIKEVEKIGHMQLYQTKDWR